MAYVISKKQWLLEVQCRYENGINWLKDYIRLLSINELFCWLFIVNLLLLPNKCHTKITENSEIHASEFCGVGI